MLCSRSAISCCAGRRVSWISRAGRAKRALGRNQGYGGRDGGAEPRAGVAGAAGRASWMGSVSACGFRAAEGAVWGRLGCGGLSANGGTGVPLAGWGAEGLRNSVGDSANAATLLRGLALIVAEFHGVDGGLVRRLLEVKLGAHGHQIAEPVDGDVAVIDGDGNGLGGKIGRQAVGSHADAADAARAAFDEDLPVEANDERLAV